MTAVTADLKTLDNARHEFAHFNGSMQVTLAYLKLALGLSLLALLASLVVIYHVQTQAANVKPFIIRIDEVGRAQAVSYDAATSYQPRAPELRYFLTDFVVKHYSRLRATLTSDFPKSLFFLDPALVEATIQAPVLETFVKNGAADEVEIVVKNVTFSELVKSPYKAQVDFEKHYAHNTKLKELHVAQLDFMLEEHVPNAYIPVNPLGIRITYFRVDQAF